MLGRASTALEFGGVAAATKGLDLRALAAQITAEVQSRGDMCAY